jgi:lipopolysaccharide/colanic/teichoic acid biosynthesis glycosyltransferase
LAIDPNQGLLQSQFSDPLMEARSFGFYPNIFKRVVDLTVVLLLAIPAMIIVGIIAIIIALSGANPFYSQERIGKNGRIFRMWKLRSMVPNAKERLREYLAQNPEARAEWNKTQKLKNDPRITKIGHIIRKTSLDELPQLLNVYFGDMSLVGPRPIMREQRKLYPGQAYYKLSPGITGFWQISERNETSFAERAYYDTSYLQQLSLATDLRVLLQTVTVVLRGTGY